jgi:hypothetical protein
MTLLSLRRGALVLAVLGAACTEPRVAAHLPEPVSGIEARLQLSDSVLVRGSEVVVWVKLRGAGSERIASFTTSVAYDTTALRYQGELPLTDGATRVINPAAGRIRSAGMHAEGFVNGTLAAYRFIVLDPQAGRRVNLTVEEMHLLDRSDVSRTVHVLSGASAGEP